MRGIRYCPDGAVPDVSPFPLPGKGARRGLGPMLTKQISVFIENRAGRLARVTGVLRDAGVNIRAISMADAPDFGIFRLVVDDTERGLSPCTPTASSPSSPTWWRWSWRTGRVRWPSVLETLAAREVNVEYMYASLAEVPGKAVVFLRFEDSQRAVGRAPERRGEGRRLSAGVRR